MSPVSGKMVSIIAFFLLLGLAYFTYYVAPTFVTPYFEVRPEQTAEHFDAAETALRAYFADHNALPKEDFILDYRRSNKNLWRTRSPGMTVYHVAALTSPVRYIEKEQIPDPYAIPAQFCPFTYKKFPLANGDLAVVMTSAGPNLVYDIRPWMFQDMDTVEPMRELTARMTYDPSNGTKSFGDFARVLVFEGAAELAEEQSAEAK